MKFTTSIFLAGLLSASTAVATPVLPRADSTLRLTMHGTDGKTYPIDVPLDGKIYSPPNLSALKNLPAISTIDKWKNFDNVWCGFGPADAKQISYGSDDVTHFNPALVIGEIQCSPPS